MKRENKYGGLKGNSNWYVVTGGPGSGKTTVINHLNMLGYHATIEHARHFIDSRMITGRSVEEIRKNQLEFQRGILEMQHREKEPILF